MGLGIRIEDGRGLNGTAAVTDDNLNVVNVGYPPFRRQRTKVYSAKLANAAGSNDMGVDGSTTPVKFYTSTDQDDDTYITRMNILLGYGASAPLYNFVDSGAPLTNGIEFGYTNAFGEEVIIAELKTMYDILLFSLSDGHIPTAWELRNLGASNDYGILAAIDLARVIPYYGIQLLHGTTQDIFLRINDDCTDADLFEVIAVGFQRFE